MCEACEAIVDFIAEEFGHDVNVGALIELIEGSPAIRVFSAVHPLRHGVLNSKGVKP